MNEGDLHHIRSCFYALFFQLFPIIFGTLVSFARSKLSANDALFAVLVMLSPTTMHVLSLVPFDLRRVRYRPASEIIDAVCMALILLLSVAVYIVVSIFLAKTDCGNTTFKLPETAHPAYTVAAVFSVVLHIFRVPGSFVLRYLLQLSSFSVYSGVVCAMLTWVSSLQMLGVWEAECVKTEWKTRLSTWCFQYSEFSTADSPT